MAEPLDYTAKVKAKGLDNTGVTEEIAKQMYNGLGRRTVAVVEFEHSGRTDTADGRHAVALAVTMVEPALGEQSENALREFARALHKARLENGGQPVLPGTQGAGAMALPDAENLLKAESEDLWSGDTGEPLPSGDVCPFPSCTLPPGHDGDHDVFRDDPEGGDPADEGEADSGDSDADDAAPDNVVKFSGS